MPRAEVCIGLGIAIGLACAGRGIITWQSDMPAWPARAVRMDAYRLGKDVPMAPIVRPMTVSVTPSAQPILAVVPARRGARDA